MSTKKYSVALAVSMAFLVVAASASSWEGSAMTGSHDDFPASGYYAACNSFPRDSSVEIVNLENGRTISVVVTKGLDSSGIFMILSVEASRALGLQPGRVARIRASEPRISTGIAPAAGTGTSYDPELNPRVLAAQELKRLGYELEPQTPASSQVVPGVSATRVEPGTVVLPQLPEPGSPAATASPAGQTPPATTTPELAATGTGLPASAPEARALPVPDETPLRVSVDSAPKVYGAPAFRPEVLGSGLAAPAATEPSVALADPLPVSEARAIALARSAPERYNDALAGLYNDPDAPGVETASAIARSAPPYGYPEADAALLDPSAPASGRALAYSRSVPEKAPSDVSPELAWPVLEADELPDVIQLAMTAPPPDIPSTSLAEGEIIFESGAGPSTLARETPAYGAAETRVTLDDAQLVTSGRPVAGPATDIRPQPAELPGELAEALEQKPETSVQAGSPATETAPDVALEAPGEYIVALEPSPPKPPVAGTESAPAARTAPAVTTTPAGTAPAVAATPPAPPASVPPAATVPPAGATVVSGALEKGRFYIQLGAYGSESAARDSMARLKTGYAVLLQKVTEKGKDSWRVFVGPLSRDESGVALVRVRAMGFKDAFVKSGG